MTQENHAKKEEDRTPEELVVDFQDHTVFVLCGPTMCGKSSFAREVKDALLEKNIQTAVLSSDAYRVGLLWTKGFVFKNDDRHSPWMLSASQQAFERLFTDLKAYTSFPICARSVIVDTTGFDSRFREEVYQIARSNNYKIVLVTFEYKSQASYLLPEFTDKQISIVNQSRDKFRRQVLPTLAHRSIDERIRVKSRYVKPVVNYTFDNSKLGKLVAKKDEVFAVIGDSHECVEELKELIGQIETKYPSSTIIHVGDYLDKGGETKEMVDYMHERIFPKEGKEILVDANHESYVIKRLQGEIEACEVEKDQFTSLEVLMTDKYRAGKVMSNDLYAVPFVHIEFPETCDAPVYITHAPCRTEELGKVHGHCLRNQRNYRTQDRSKPVKEEFEWLYKDSNSIWPLHIFGHQSHLLSEGDPRGLYKKMVYKNRVFLDTGAVYGGHLTAAIVQNGRIVEFLQVKAKKVRKESDQPADLGKGPDISARPFNIHEYDLDEDDFRLLRQIERNKVRYISGTMAPGPSSKEDIEPLSEAFAYLKVQGVEKVTIQPKYMGSRAQLYLFSGQPEKTFLVSRGGWKIRGVTGLSAEEYQAFLLSLYEKHKDKMIPFSDIILDGELMPWAALGEDLIQRNFTAYEALVVNELSTLATDKGFAALEELARDTCLKNKVAHIAAFHDVLATFAEVTEPEFKPFSILWSAGDCSNSPPISNEAEKFYFVTDGEVPYMNVSLDNEKEKQEAAEWFEKLTVDQKMEGVVLKPIKGDVSIPFMKVRSEEYLRLVYGYDWMDRRERLCWQKRITDKVNLSKREAGLARQMLDATEENRKEFAVKMISQVKRERELDPRL